MQCRFIDAEKHVIDNAVSHWWVVFFCIMKEGSIENGEYVHYITKNIRPPLGADYEQQ